ncbi:unnamed protein product [Linum tenue]|nr:unnamed protein product [Linum tenue]
MWSLLDVFELLGGFQTGFGLYYVDLDDPNLTRYPKLSAHWYSRFLKGATVGSADDVSNGAFELAAGNFSHLITTRSPHRRSTSG